MKTINHKLHEAVNIINKMYALGLIWHPDDDFREWDDITETHAEELNNDMNKLHTLCDECGVDVYGMTLAFNLRSYTRVTSYVEDGMVCIGMSDDNYFDGATECNGEYFNYVKL
jgi:tRNA G26 N,N-dimethylase Trm1